jgi:PPOX class probable FMN-dependent enzyme
MQSSEVSSPGPQCRGEDNEAMRREVTTADELRAIVGEPDEYVSNKVKDRLSPVQRDWLAHSPLAFIATTDVQGRVDVSPKGDPPGFIHVIDDRTIAIPDRPGNKRVDGYRNVLQRSHVGTVFLIPGRGDTLRINGRARILADADYFDTMTVQGKRPLLALEIAIEEVFFHCAKAFLRSNAWKPETWNPTALPSVAEIAKALRSDWTEAQLDERYNEDNMRRVLY